MFGIDSTEVLNGRLQCFFGISRVRLDWDISRTWSVVTVRNENGIFGLDLFFRKRIK